MATDALVTYLNDHLAGSTAALQLLDHLVEESDPGDSRKFFSTLRAEIAEDRSMLDDPAGDSLKELETLEVLVLGIHGKRLLWAALMVVARAVPQWADVNFARLEQRAVEQEARVEARRLDAVGLLAAST